MTGSLGGIILGSQSAPPSFPNMVTSGSQNPKWQKLECQSRGFKTRVPKPVGDVTAAMFIVAIQSMAVSRYLSVEPLL